MSAVAIVGAGLIGRATAAYLAHHGHRVGLWSPSGRGTAALGRVPGGDAGPRARLRYEGALSGEAEVDILSGPEAVSACDVMVIALPGPAYRAVLPRVVPRVRSAQTVIVSGALSLIPLWLFERIAARGQRPTIAGWGTTLATARSTPTADVQVNTVRARFEVAAIPAANGAAALAVCQGLFGDRFRLVDTILATALSNINPVAHAAEALPNLTRMERAERWALFDCLTPAAARIAEALDRERRAIAQGFGLQVRSIAEHYHLSYHVPLGSVADMAAAIHARYQGPPGPTTLEHRYILEDVPYGLVFYEALARAASVAAPVMSAAITLASAAYGCDFRGQNPFLADLELDRADGAGLLARCAAAGTR
jgi:opine dehydrogenase